MILCKKEIKKRSPKSFACDHHVIVKENGVKMYDKIEMLCNYFGIVYNNEEEFTKKVNSYFRDGLQIKCTQKYSIMQH